MCNKLKWVVISVGKTVTKFIRKSSMISIGMHVSKGKNIGRIEVK